MSTSVSTIRDNIKQVIVLNYADNLELDYVYNIEKNKSDAYHNRFGVIPKQSIFNRETNSPMNYTMVQDFEIVYTSKYINDNSDQDMRNKLDLLYEKAHVIFKALINTRINTSIVINVDDPEIMEPEIILTEKTIILRTLIRVYYREKLSS